MVLDRSPDNNWSVGQSQNEFYNRWVKNVTSTVLEFIETNMLISFHED